MRRLARNLPYYVWGLRPEYNCDGSIPHSSAIASASRIARKLVAFERTNRQIVRIAGLQVLQQLFTARDASRWAHRKEFLVLDRPARVLREHTRVERMIVVTCTHGPGHTLRSPLSNTIDALPAMQMVANCSPAASPPRACTPKSSTCVRHSSWLETCNSCLRCACVEETDMRRSIQSLSNSVFHQACLVSSKT
ncbi:MAG: hypothetical protein R3C56_04790 [Pirellulaceae bacterium]